jgi:putative phosphoesterase
MGGIVQLMKVAFISDVHGNAVALESCTSFLRSKAVDRIFHLGDALGYFPFASETIALLSSNNVTCLKGNHEAMALGELELLADRDSVYGLSSTIASIESDERTYISGWADHIKWSVDGKCVLLVHGSPWNRLEGYVYPDSEKSKFAHVDADVVIMGHTHYPFVASHFGKLLINVGSVGLPRDVGHLSSVCIVDTEDWSTNIFRIPIELDSLRLKAEGRNVHSAVWKCMERWNADYLGKLVNIESSLE